MGQNQSSTKLPQAAANDPDAMKAWICEKKTMETPTQALQLVSLPRPEPKETEVVIKVEAAGLNPIDYKRSNYSFCTFPAVPGVDGAGVVEKVGAGVEVAANAQGLTPLRVGERVQFHLDVTKSFGSFAEYCVCEAHAVVRIPDDISFTEAASVPCAGWTAYTALFTKMKIETGRTILIVGASGGVGSFAVQLAKRMGLFVIGVASTSSLTYLTDTLKCDLALDYTEQNVVEKALFATKGVGVDYLLDLVGVESGLLCAQALRFGGTLCQVTGGAVKCDESFFRRQISVHHVYLNGYHVDDMNRHVLRQLGEVMTGMLQQKAIAPVEIELIKFEQIPAALEKMSERHSRGKLVALIHAPSKPGKKEEHANGQKSVNGASPATPVGASEVDHNVVEQPPTLHQE